MKDRFGREIDYLRISITDRCNLRCRYCFYADEMCRRETPSYGIMTEETLSLVLEKHLPGPIAM